MKLTSILALNEGAYSKLAEWEDVVKKLGYTVTKDNKSGTYHAWDGTSHKGRFTTPTGKGSLTEATAPRKGTVAWEREQQRKKKERDPEEAKRIEKIGDKNHQVGNAKVAHESTSRAYEIGYDAFLADKTKCPYQPGSDDATDWNLGWEAAQSRERSNEGVKEGTVHYGQPANTQSFKVTYYDPKYDETRTSVIKSRSKEAALEFCTAKGYDVQSIEQQGVKEGLDKQALKQKLDKINAQLALSHPRYQNPNSPTSNRYFELKKQKDEIIAQLKQGVTEGISDTIKRGVKQVQRGMQGWGNQGMKNMTDKETPRDLVNRNKGYDDEKVKSLSKFRKAVDQERPAPAHSPQALQNRVLDREMKKRGLGETATNTDMTGCKCTKCSKGTYQETSQMDNTDGVLHCTNCGTKVARYSNVTEGKVGAAVALAGAIALGGAMGYKHATKDPNVAPTKTSQAFKTTAQRSVEIGQKIKKNIAKIAEAYTGHFNDDDWYEVDPKTNTVLRHAGGHAAYRPTMSGQPIKLPNGNVLMRGMRAKSLRPVEEGSEEKVTTVATQPKYKSVKYNGYAVRQEGPKQWAIVGATVRRFATLLAAKNYIDNRL